MREVSDSGLGAASADDPAPSDSAMMGARDFDAADYLTTPEDRVAYLEALIEDGDAMLIAEGIGEIARAMGASDFAQQAGVSREAVYKGLVEGGNPTLETLTKALKALGLRLAVVPAA